MSEDLNDQKYQKAQERVRRLRGFYSSIITFVLVNIFLLIINLITSPRHLWFWWVTLIWGIILIVQAFSIFTIKDRFLGEEWEQKKIKELMDKDKKNPPPQG